VSEVSTVQKPGPAIASRPRLPTALPDATLNALGFRICTPPATGAGLGNSLAGDTRSGRLFTSELIPPGARIENGNPDRNAPSEEARQFENMRFKSAAPKGLGISKTEEKIRFWRWSKSESPRSTLLSNCRVNAAKPFKLELANSRPLNKPKSGSLWLSIEWP